MSNQEILEKAIQKAIDGGWETNHFVTLKGGYKHPDESEFLDILGNWHGISPLDVIFNHDFAKALWGEHEVSHDKPDGKSISSDYRGARYSEMTRVTNEGWQYHLQNMVISLDPIKYLSENI